MEKITQSRNKREGYFFGTGYDLFETKKILKNDYRIYKTSKQRYKRSVRSVSLKAFIKDNKGNYEWAYR